MNPELILLVEDDLNLRLSIALILQRAGYTVTTTDCVHTAMDIVQSGDYKLLITDINMPETRNLLQPQVLDIYPSLSIVVLTDQPIPTIENNTEGFQAHYLSKPIAPERLMDCVGSLMGKNGNCDDK